MIVAIIGVALASLTRAASREASIGGSKVVIRNNLSLTLRQLRQDIANSSIVMYAAGKLSLSSTTATPVLILATNRTMENVKVQTRVGSGDELTKTRYITYCFKRGSVSDNVQPEGAFAGGVLYRTVTDVAPSVANACSSLGKAILSHVKYIPSTYPTPLFCALDRTGGWTGCGVHNNMTNTNAKSVSGSLKVNLIVELENSRPIVNDSVEEVFMLTNGNYNQ